MSYCLQAGVENPTNPKIKDSTTNTAPTLNNVEDSDKLFIAILFEVLNSWSSVQVSWICWLYRNRQVISAGTSDFTFYVDLPHSKMLFVLSASVC